MRLYMAGAISGNLNGFWHEVARLMKIYLAGGEGRHWLYDPLYKRMNDEAMEIFMASNGIWRSNGLYDDIIATHHPFILESFYYADADTERLIPLFGDFLLDSGAFTFMQDNSSHQDWDSYIERYAAFIVRNDIRKYFELDIDSVVGYEKVKEYRKKLETLTNRPCIPVWHNNRGKDEFIRMCEEYDYVAIGGLVGGNSEYSQKYWKYFPWFINTAHDHDAKIHALGFTSLKGIEQYHFDSVDSTAWTTGNRFGYIYHFNGRTMEKIDVPKGKRLGDPRKVALINYTEWVKFQKYAETHL